MIGVALRVGEESDSDTESSDIEESDEESDEDEVAERAARVCWMNWEESIEKVGDLKVIDRKFFHGDIVAKAIEPLEHMGTVVNVDMMVDLELPNGRIMRDVNSRSLCRVRAFGQDDYVIHDRWLGLVEEVVDNVTVLFDDGSKCKVMRANPIKLYPLNETVIDDSGFPFFQGQKVYSYSAPTFKHGNSPFFQGQKVRADSASIFEHGEWLKGSFKASSTEGTVVEVEPDTAIVYWIAERPALTAGSSHQTPSREMNARKLLPITYFSHTYFYIGGQSLPPTPMHPSSMVQTEGCQVDGIHSDGDAEALVDNTNNSPPSLDSLDPKSCGTGESCSKGWGEACTLHSHTGKQLSRQTKREKEMQNKEKEKPVEYTLLVVNTRTTVDVMWQDGTLSHGVDACDLVPVNHIGDHEFWPEQYVLERGLDGEGVDDGPRRVGIVRVVDSKQRMASVRWLKHVNLPEEPREFEPEELMSLYELVEHPGYPYCFGDVVIRITAEPSPLADIPTVEDRVLPGLVRVDTPEAEPEDNDEGEGLRGKAPETTGQRKIEKVQSNPPSQDLPWVGVIKGLQDGDIEVAWADGTVSKVGPQALIRVVELDPGGDLDSAQSNDLKDAEDIDDAANSEMVEFENDNGRRIQDLPEGGSVLGRENYFCPENEEDLGEELRSDGSGDRDDEEETVEEGCAEIKNFDCVKDPSDHHYICETSQPTIQQKWVKKIQQEWVMLEKNLPDTIFVRVYEERMDLLRAVIIGAKQTPYHDGLFVFDVYMRPDYPTVPPLVYYHSGGLRLNPNLNENGTVCLSLLGTWSGKGSENWHPPTSSILQVLVSIQGLVLNEKPYFNEAGYGKQVGTGEGEKNSALYNENSFLLSCKSMLYLLRRPPMQLEDLIRDHFQKLGTHVLLACKAYLAGAEVGSLTESDLLDVEERKFGDQSTAGFKIMLKKLVPKLTAAFEEAGAKSS